MSQIISDHKLNLGLKDMETWRNAFSIRLNCVNEDQRAGQSYAITFDGKHTVYFICTIVFVKKDQSVDMSLMRIRTTTNSVKCLPSDPIEEEIGKSSIA